MKRTIYVLLDLLTLAFLAGGYIFHSFARKKLGMMRWLNYNNRKLQEEMPLDTLKYAAVIVVVILAAVITIEFVKTRVNLGRIDAIMVAVMIILAALYSGFSAFMNVESMSSYYFVMPLLGGAAVMQIIRNALALIYR